MIRWLLPLVLVLICVVLVACSKATTIQEELKNMHAGDRQALLDLLKDTGVAAESLRPIGIRGIDRNARAVATDEGRIVGLRLSGVTLKDLAPVGRMGALQVLWLTECTVQGLGGLSGHPALREVSFAGSKVSQTELAALQGSKLKVIADDGNKEKAVPAKDDKDNKDKGQAATGAGGEVTGVVAKLPPQKGKATGGKHRSEGTILTAHLEMSGRYEGLSGAHLVGLFEAESFDPTVTLEVGVEQGRVRGYLALKEGYRYVEATPGRSGRIVGWPVYTGTQYAIVLESLDGDAKGVSYRVFR
jgi:hypothetical protein